MTKVVTIDDMAGGMILDGSDGVKINGKGIALDGSLVAPHGSSPHSPRPTMISSEVKGKIRINGILS